MDEGRRRVEGRGEKSEREREMKEWETEGGGHDHMEIVKNTIQEIGPSIARLIIISFFHPRFRSSLSIYLCLSDPVLFIWRAGMPNTYLLTFYLLTCLPACPP